MRQRRCRVRVLIQSANGLRPTSGQAD